ncbi:camp-dependent protein kinase regulatory subunit [Dentipellis sp. KUC8613]|nr:camp-dependent protein kinase regulatory subunit [Dentipellis sp. KUC8613]
MSTFDALLADLSRDASRVQPRDALQFCANWFQSRLEEQRTRTRDAIARHPDAAAALPTDHWMDAPVAPTTAPPTAASPFTDPFEPRRSSVAQPRTQSPFAPDVPNGVFSSDGIPDPNTTAPPPPTFRFEGEFIPPQQPLESYTMQLNNYDHVTPSHSPPPVEYLGSRMHILERRTSVSAEPILVDSDVIEPLPVFHKSKGQIRRIRNSIKDIFLFKDLDEEQEMGAINAMQEKKVVANQVVIRQGDIGDYFYVVESGLFHVYIGREPLPDSIFRDYPPLTEAEQQLMFNSGFDMNTLGKLVQECRQGSYFGELALMYGHPRKATVIAQEDSTLWTLDRMTFRTIILKAAHRRRTTYEKFLSSVSLLSSLSNTERSKIADALESKVYEDGEVIVRQGEMGDTFFFVEEGEATVTQTQQGEDGEVVEVMVGHLIKGDYFGELSLLRLAPRAATVSAIDRGQTNSPKLKVAALDAQAFTRLLGPLREIMERNAGSYNSLQTKHGH